MFWLNKHAPHRNNLSPYVDGRLTPAQTTALEAHLAVCEPCRHELEGLRATVAAVRDLPQAETPRSFALTPQMLEQGRAVAPAPSTPPIAIGMRMASAAVAVVLAVVVIGDLSEGGNGIGGDSALESASKSRDPTELAPGPDEQASDEAGADAPAATGVGEQNDARATDADSQATTAPPAGNFAAACPSLGDQTAAGGASSPTPAPGATAQPTPSPTTGSGTNGGGAGAAGGATAGCDETSITTNQDPGSEATPAAEPAVGAISENEASEAADSSVDNDDSVSTLRIIEIVLAGSLTVLLVGIAADFILRRRSI